MNVIELIEIAGGRKAVITETGLTRGRISQWCVNNYIPPVWIKYFRAQYPKIRRAQIDLAEPAKSRKATS